MILLMSEPFEEEMLQRARQLVTTRGKRVDRGHHDWFLAYQADRLYLSIREDDDKVGVHLKHPDKVGVWAIYYVDLDHVIGVTSESIYQPEHYEECVKLMRALLVLDDLADV